MNQPAKPATTPPSPAPIKAVLFDLDDTLWAIEPVLVRAENLLYDWLRENAPEVVKHHTIASLRARRMALLQSEPAYHIDLWKLRHTVLTAIFTEHNEDLTRVADAMALFTEARNAVTVFDDVVPSLQLLKNSLTLGTVSNGFADLGHIGLAEHFEISLAAHRFGTAKPDPAIFHAACDALKVAPEEAVYVGDDLTLDVQGAQQAGLRGVWMNRFDRSLPDGFRPDAICKDLHELRNWLASLPTAET